MDTGATRGTLFFFNVLLTAHLGIFILVINPLKPNDDYSSRTAPLTSKRCTHIGTEYFKHDIYCPFFFLFKMQFVS